MHTAHVSACMTGLDRVPRLTRDDERDLAARIATGDLGARNRLVEANIKLVIRIARDFQGRGVPLDDLIGEGNFGLIRAAEVFDPERSPRFSTVASLWVKAMIRRAVELHGAPIRISHDARTLASRWERATADLAKIHDRPPTDAEVRTHLGISEDRAANARHALAVRRASNGYWVDGGDGDWDDDKAPIRDPGATDPADTLIGEEELRAVVAKLRDIDNDEADVIRLRYGLGSLPPMQPQQVARRLGKTVAEVEAIEAGAIDRIAAAVCE